MQPRLALMAVKLKRWAKQKILDIFGNKCLHFVSLPFSSSGGSGSEGHPRPSAHSIQRIRALFGEGKPPGSEGAHPPQGGVVTTGSSRASSASGTPKTSYGHQHHTGTGELIYFPPGTLNHSSIAAALAGEHGGNGGESHPGHHHPTSSIYSESAKEGWLHVKISSIDGKVMTT